MDAIRANEHAVHADETFIADQNPAFGVYVAGYYPHNYDFMAFAASMIGRSEQAIAATEKMMTLSPDELLWVPGMEFLQHHRTRHLQFKVRFAKWDEILEVPAPDEGLPHATAMWHYATGRALVGKGDIAGAKMHLKALQAASKDPVLADLKLEFNMSGVILSIATDVLAGHIAAAEGNLEAAVEHLRRAALSEDDLIYGEPPDWSVPVREELGVVLLKAGKASDAEQVFKEDLDHFPENGWSLHGLALALRAQNRTEEADAVMKRFDKIWATADVTLDD
jgi:tetratricopeptide (TPR) repeat protein